MLFLRDVGDWVEVVLFVVWYLVCGGVGKLMRMRVVEEVGVC